MSARMLQRLGARTLGRRILQKDGRCPASTSSETTHFGYQEVPTEEKAKKVGAVFSSVADSYDMMNDAMSVGIHRLWKDYFAFRVDPSPKAKILDVAGGTGDIAFRLAERRGLGSASFPITVCDINAEMLGVGKRRAEEGGLGADVAWVEGNAERLPFPADSFDLYTIAFGIRNVTNVPKALSEAHRVLKKGGRFFCLEFSRVDNVVLRKLYDAYSFEVIPVLGHLIAGDWGSYQYLVESIRRFPPQKEFEEMISTAGFKAVSHENITNGVVAIHSGVKL